MKTANNLIPYKDDREPFLSCILPNSSLKSTHYFHLSLLNLKTLLPCNDLKVTEPLSIGNQLRNLNLSQSKENANKSNSFQNTTPTLRQSNLNNSRACAELDSNKNINKNNGLKHPALKPYIMGIDPGITGAISVIDVSRGYNVFVDVFDMPLNTIIIKGKKRNRIDLYRLALAVGAYAADVRVALIEEVNARPSDGKASIFAFGYATGAVAGVLAAFDVPVESVKPSVWKCAMGLGSDKAQSITRALKHFPTSSSFLQRQKDHGRAEAILIAWFAAKHLRSA